MEFLTRIEQLPFSTWVREGGDLYGYALILFLHTLGLATVVGGNLLIDLRLLGFWQKMPVKPLERLYPILWGAFAVNAITGVILIMADATIKLANPTFYVKMALIAVALTVFQRKRQKIFRNPEVDDGVLPSGTKALAWISLICWLAALTAGRLLAYLGPVAGLA
jgi:hypothetical protein